MEHNFKYEFEKLEDLKETKETSGFTLQEKNCLYEVLINYGIPVSASDESKEDYQLLQILFTKYMKDEDAETKVDTERIKNLERFIQNLNTMSAKIINEYRVHVTAILKQWKEEDE